MAPKRRIPKRLSPAQRAAGKRLPPTPERRVSGAGLPKKRIQPALPEAGAQTALSKRVLPKRLSPAQRAAGEKLPAKPPPKPRGQPVYRLDPAVKAVAEVLIKSRTMSDLAIGRYFKSRGQSISAGYIGRMRRDFGLPPVEGPAVGKREPGLGKARPPGQKPVARASKKGLPPGLRMRIEWLLSLRKYSDAAIQGFLEAEGEKVSLPSIARIRRKMEIPRTGSRASALYKQFSFNAARQLLSKKRYPDTTVSRILGTAGIPVSSASARRLRKEMGLPIVQEAAAGKKEPKAFLPGEAWPTLPKVPEKKAEPVKLDRAKTLEIAKKFLDARPTQEQRIASWEDLNLTLLSLRRARSRLSRKSVRKKLSPRKIAAAKRAISTQIETVETLLASIKPFLPKQEK